MNWNLEHYWLALDYYKIDVDPFGSGIDPATIFETQDVKRTQLLIRRALKDRLFVAVVAPPGSGKSAALSYALTPTAQQNVKVIEMPVLEIENVKIVNVIDELLITLTGSNDGQRLSSNRRERLLKEVLYNAGHCVLVIDEAQLINPSTLRAIKRLWTLKYAGKSPLLSIVLLSQERVERLIDDIAEVDKRVHRVKLVGMDSDEVTGYLQSRAADLFPDSVCVEISRYARYPLDVNAIARKAITSAFTDSRPTTTIDDVSEAIGVNWLRMRREKLGFSREEFAELLSRELKIDKRVIEQAESGISPAEKLKKAMLAATAKMEGEMT